MRIFAIVHEVMKWFMSGPGGPFRFRAGSAILWWVLVSLCAISFVGNHPIVGLCIAVSGGIVIGVLLVIGAEPTKS